MPSNYLIFLLIGVFIICRPTTSRPIFKELNEEIQDLLDKMIKQFPVAQNLNPTTFRIPVLTKMEQCAMLRLKVFITLLDPVELEDDKASNFRELYSKLQDFDKLWSLQEQKSDQECKTEEYVHLGVREVLDDLRRLMEALYCIQKKC